MEADDAVRLGLRQVNGLRETAGRGIAAARTERPFTSLDDFLRRTPLQAAERRALAAAENVSAPPPRSALTQASPSTACAIS